MVTIAAAERCVSLHVSMDPFAPCCPLLSPRHWSPPFPPYCAGVSFVAWSGLLFGMRPFWPINSIPGRQGGRGDGHHGPAGGHDLLAGRGACSNHRKNIAQYRNTTLSCTPPGTNFKTILHTQITKPHAPEHTPAPLTYIYTQTSAHRVPDRQKNWGRGRCPALGGRR